MGGAGGARAEDPDLGVDEPRRQREEKDAIFFLREDVPAEEASRGGPVVPPETVRRPADARALAQPMRRRFHGRPTPDALLQVLSYASVVWHVVEFAVGVPIAISV